MGLFRRKDSPYWWYRIRLNGRVCTGSTNTFDKKLAHRIYLENHRQFVDESHFPDQNAKQISFFKMCDEYLEKHAKVNKRSWDADACIIGKLKDHFGDIQLGTIRPQDIEGFKAKRLKCTKGKDEEKRPIKPATINRELTVLKTIFNKAILWGYADRNPMRGVRLFKEEFIPIKILSREERKKLLEASPDFLKPILVTALKTGMRHGEIRGLRWEEVDLENGIISVTHTKSKKLREIPIHPELSEMLAALPNRSAYVFCDEGGEKLKQDGIIRHAFDQLKKQCGMPDLTFHALRHNFASELISKGADIRTVQEYMGHSSLRMLQRYAHMNKGIWRSTIQLLGSDLRQEMTTL